MSSFVCGYIEPILNENKLSNLSDYIKNSQLGIEKISKDWLINYPDYLIPNDNIFTFLIGDVPGYPNSTYLTSYDEYAPNIDMVFLRILRNA